MSEEGSRVLWPTCPVASGKIKIPMNRAKLRRFTYIFFGDLSVHLEVPQTIDELAIVADHCTIHSTRVDLRAANRSEILLG